jgi:cobalt-zinc-cadmium efflux system membrane fusion protein
MPAPKNWLARLSAAAVTSIAIILTVIVGAMTMTDLPSRLGLADADSKTVDEDHEGHDHEGQDHAGHDDAESVELSQQARRNMRLRTAPISVRSYTRYIEVPGVVTNWPGRTHVAVTSPLTGVLNSILVSRGELVASGMPLFTLRLTHQDLVNTQATFLTQLGELDVEQREIERLSAIANSGAIAGKALITRKYEQDKLLAGVRAARQAMLLHGLTEQQIAHIEQTRELIREVTVYAPAVHEDRSLHHDSLRHNHANAAAAGERYASLAQPPTAAAAHPRHIDAQFLVTELHARRGQSVLAGDELAQLSDYSQILIEGHAFQRDGDALRAAADAGADVQAVMESSGDGPDIIDGLKVAYIGAEVGRQSRSLPFYVSLENKVERSEQRGDKSYISWQFKPGQRLTLRLPVSRIENAIVVPKDAVAEEGAERYLFVENGDHFDRIPVAVVARDSVSVAIANDGQVWPGQSIAISGAHQLQMELKNKSGGAIDPHAGHNH